MSNENSNSEGKAGVSYKTILLLAFIITSLCLYSLIATASSTGNWKGAYISIFHVVFLAAASLVAVRK